MATTTTATSVGLTLFFPFSIETAGTGGRGGAHQLAVGGLAGFAVFSVTVPLRNHLETGGSKGRGAPAAHPAGETGRRAEPLHE